MDAEYLTTTLGKTLAKGCAATITAAPTDPIHYLSLWLLKYAQNAKIETDFWKQKELLLQEQFFNLEKQRQEELAEKQHSERQLEAINQVRLIHNDPYLLFSTCLQAVSTFTGCTSAYFALVLDKIWAPPKKNPNGEEENTENEENPEQEEEEGGEDEGQENQDAAEGAELLDETGSDEAGQGGEVDRDQQGEESNLGNLQEMRAKKKGKPPKPPNYKKKVLLYVSATQNDTFMVNKQLTKKLGPVTFSVFLKGVAKLHVANVLYQEDTHFFRGLPRMGAYITVPVLLNSSPAQVAGLLCLDTLKKEHAGNGRPFSLKEQDFIAAIANAAGEALTTSSANISLSYKTKEVIKDLQDKVQQIEASRKAELKRERAAMMPVQNSPGTKMDSEKEGGSAVTHDDSKNENGEERSDTQVEDKVEGEIKDTDDSNEANDDVEDEIVGDEESDKYESAKEDGHESEVEEENEREENGEHEEETEFGDEGGDQKHIHTAERDLKQQHKIVAKLEKNFKMCQSRLERQATRVAKLEKQLKHSGGTLHHLRMLLAGILDMMVKYKDEELFRIKQFMFPPTPIYRILKALLHVLGHGKIVVDDWTRAREVFNDEIFNAIRSYSPVSEKDLKLWELADVYIDGITEETLADETPIGYLGHQWLLGAKKVAFRAIKHEILKTENEKTAKDFADTELDQMVAEIDLRVAIDEEKRMAIHLEDLQSKFAQEITVSSRPAHEDESEEVGNEDE